MQWLGGNAISRITTAIRAFVVQMCAISAQICAISLYDTKYYVEQRLKIKAEAADQDTGFESRSSSPSPHDDLGPDLGNLFTLPFINHVGHISVK